MLFPSVEVLCRGKMCLVSVVCEKAETMSEFRNRFQKIKAGELWNVNTDAHKMESVYGGYYEFFLKSIEDYVTIRNAAVEMYEYLQKNEGGYIDPLRLVGPKMEDFN